MNILNKYIKDLNAFATSKIDELTYDLLNDDEQNIFNISSVNEFRNKLINGIARTNQFIVSFSFPNFLKEASFASLFGITDFSDEVGIYCYQISGPKKKLNTQTVRVYNNLKRKVPNGYSWDDITLSFYDTNDRKIFKLFDNWITGINNPVTNCGLFYDDSYGQIKTKLTDRNGKQKGYIVYEEAIPTAVEIKNLAWDDKEEFISVDVNFSYIYPITKDYGISSLYNFGYSFADSDAMKFVDTLFPGTSSSIINNIKNTSESVLDKVVKWF